MKKFLSLTLAASMSLALLAGCGSSNGGGSDASKSGDGSNTAGGTIKVAAIETSYGTEVWQKVADAFTEQTGIKVELTIDKKLEDVIGPSMQGGDYPDVIHLATGREAALTEQFIKGNLIADITDVLSMTVPGESKKVSEKIAGGFTDTSLTNPYGDGKTYLAPMFYSPCGLFYNAGFLKEKGWDVPKTWDEMWELGEKAKAEGTYLFTYPTTGYFDAFFYALMYAAGGPEFFNKATHYEEGIWDTPEAKTCFDIVAKLASYTNPITPAQANDQDFTQNQQLVLDNKALFMPNGTWIVGEMAEAPRADGFEWGMTALPAVKAGGDQYSYTWFEQAWIPAGAEHLDAAKQFVAYLYSDEACKLFAESGAIQPVLGIADSLEGDNKMFYSIYDNGAKAAMGNFAAFSAIPGVEVRTVFFDPVNSLVSGSMTEQQWIARARHGDADAFEQLVVAYEGPVYRLALRMCGSAEDAREVAQDAFLAAWRGLPAFRGDSRFSSWLYRLTTNAAIDFLRREKHHLGNLPLEEAPERPDPRQPELLAEQREQQEALQRALDQLSPEHRQVLLLRVVQQMSYDEIAQALSLESGTVKSRISRARRQLREILLRQGNFFSDSAVLPNRKEG